MIDKHDQLYKDYETVKQISIVPTMLEVICRTTGMGFAAVARVTDDRWLACCVRDEIKFGLADGGELEIETTICNEIRDNKKAVIIDHVDKSDIFANHHTPKTYGFQSYISFPLILKNGEFFGTLCAIDPNPAQLNNPKIIGMFTLFVDLLSFHLQGIEFIERSHFALIDTINQLDFSERENRQYQQISTHNLQEPLRKIRMFSDLLTSRTDAGDVAAAKSIAVKINSFAAEITNMIHQITGFSDLNAETIPEIVDLNGILKDVITDLQLNLQKNQITVQYEKLPMILAIPTQMTELFFNLINNPILFFKSESATAIKVYTKQVEPTTLRHSLAIMQDLDYCEIIVEENIVIEKYDLDKIFDFFITRDENPDSEKYVAGLAHCRKIVHNHGGVFTAKSLPNRGISFSIILPTNKR